MANQPDLVIGDITLDLTYPQYSDASFSYVVQNIGTVATTISTWAVFAYDKEPVFITGGYAGSESVATLAAGASKTITELLNTDLSLGQHTIWIKADTTNKQAESNESNNLKSVTFTITPAIRADLIVENVTGETSVPQGYDLDFSYVVKNIGVKPAGSTITRYKFDDKPSSPVYSGPSDDVGALAEGASATVTSHISTVGLSAGQHTLWIGTDAVDSIREIDETNNWTPYTFTVTPNLPDLIIESITGATEVYQGGDIHFSYVLKDANGANIVSPNWSSIIFGIDRLPTSSDNDWTVSPDNIPGGGSLTLNEVLVTTHLGVGQHTLWIKADGYNQVAEGNEANNFTAFTFTVTAPVARPDLQLVSVNMNGATSVEQGEIVSFSYLVKNIGSLPSIASHAGYMMDERADATHYLGVSAINALGVNQGQWITTAVDTSSLSPGLHSVYFALDLFDAVTEITETNNWGGFTFQVTAAVRPDLVVSSITPAVTSVMQGAKFDFSYLIANTGDKSSGTGWAGFRIDQQPVQSNSLGFNQMNGLAVGGSQTLTNSFSTDNLSVGVHTLYVMADYWGNQVAETNEANNVRSITFTVTAPPRADLQVASITPSATSVVQGTKLDFSFLVENSGVAAAGSSWAGFRIDSQPDSTHADGYGAIGSLAAAGTQALGGSIDTSKLSVGTHTLYVVADYWNNQVVEGDEGNNVRSVTFTVTAPVPPDLVVDSITAASTVVQGNLLDFSYVIKNASAAGAGSSWAGFRIDSQPDSTHAGGYGAIGALAAAGTQASGGSIDTSKLSVGTHTLYVMADYWNNQVAEGDETNNVASFTFTVTAPPRPDLVVSSITPAATSVMQGANLSFSYLIENLGDASSSANWAGIWIDQQPGSGNTAGFNQTAALVAGGEQTLNNSISTANLNVGDHTLWIAADYWGNQVGESNEGNNWQSVTFTVTAPPPADLEVTSITAGASVVKGQHFDLSYVVKNMGAGAGASWAGIMVDHQPDTSHYVGFNSVGALAADGSQTLNNSIDTSDLSVGTHTLYVAADYWGNQVAEGNEANNVRSVTFEVTAADLEVSSITAGPSVMQGAAFTFSYVVENGGTAASGASWAGFMVDHAVDLAHYIGFGQTNALAVDGTQTLTGTINTAGLGVGTHTLYVAADYWNNMVGEGNEANNALSVTFEVTAPPRADLTVDSITPTAGTSVAKGDNFDFSYAIKNAGAVTAGANWAGFMIDQPVDQSHAVGFNQTGSLGAGASQTLVGSIDTSKLSVGTHTLYVAADYWGNMVSEGNEANNSLSVTFNVTSPDLFS